MAESAPTAAVPLEDRLKALAGFEPGSFPVLSLYLDLRPNQHGRDDYHAFVRKVLPERMRALAQPLPAHESFETDLARIQAYLDQNVNRAANGLAIFASAGAHLFEAIQLDAPLPEHWLFVGSTPHLFLLARLIDRYPRYAAVLLDRNQARIFVFGLASMQHAEQIAGEKTRRHSQGGWSQARFQRHIENLHAQHVKEVIETLDTLVRDEGIAHVVAAGSDEALALLRENLPANLAERLDATTRLDVNASDAEVLQATLESLQAKQVETDNQRVQELLDAWRSGGRGVAGPEATLHALEMGQVDELIIAASLDLLKSVQRLPDDAAPGPVHADTSAPPGAGDEMTLKLASELMTRAHRTGARIRFIENPTLLADFGGVGALLRFRV
jgi:peptide chain release factor subunit 1